MDRPPVLLTVDTCALICLNLLVFPVAVDLASNMHESHLWGPLMFTLLTHGLHVILRNTTTDTHHRAEEQPNPDTEQEDRIPLVATPTTEAPTDDTTAAAAQEAVPVPVVECLAFYRIPHAYNMPAGLTERWTENKTNFAHNYIIIVLILFCGVVLICASEHFLVVGFLSLGWTMMLQYIEKREDSCSIISLILLVCLTFTVTVAWLLEAVFLFPLAIGGILIGSHMTLRDETFLQKKAAAASSEAGATAGEEGIATATTTDISASAGDIEQQAINHDGPTEIEMSPGKSPSKSDGSLSKRR